MSHTTNLIYRDTTATPNLGVCIADIQAVLGSPRNDIGGLITYGAIKPWAKYKPVRSISLMMTGKTAGNTYWKASDYKCGFEFTTATEFGAPNSVGSSFAKSLYNGELDWTYARPRGIKNTSLNPTNGNEWFRFLDFDGYDHNAECPIGDLAATTVYLQLQDGVYHLHIDYDYNTPDQPVPADRLWLTLADISPDNNENTSLSTWYLGVLLFNGTTWWALTSTTTLGSDGYSLDCEFAAAYVGQWQIVPFISRDIITMTSQGVANGAYISFYNKHRETITIKLGSVTITAEASWVATRSISWEVTIENEDGASKSFTNPSVVVQRTDSASSSTGGTQIGQINLSNFSVQGETTTVLPSSTYGAITPNEDYNQAKTYWVRFTCDQQGYVTEWNQFDYDEPLEI